MKRAHFWLSASFRGRPLHTDGEPDSRQWLLFNISSIFESVGELQAMTECTKLGAALAGRLKCNAAVLKDSARLVVGRLASIFCLAGTQSAADSRKRRSREFFHV